VYQASVLVEIFREIVYTYSQEVTQMPNAELLLKEAERLSPEYFAELLDFARFLGRKHERSSTSFIAETRAEEEWPDYWAEAENAKVGSVEPKLYSATEFIEKRNFA
jgi:hypothetical protein